MANPHGNIEQVEQYQFKPGQSGNPKGRPKRTTKSELLRVLHETVTTDDFQAIVNQAIVQAKNGNRFAREYLSLYMLGRPKPMDDDEGDSVAMLIQLLSPKPAEQPKAIEVDYDANIDADSTDSSS